MNPKRFPPSPIIDNLDHIGNPFKQKQFSAAAYLDRPVVGADVDLEYALKFLYSYNGSTATFSSYRREIERLLQWAWHIEQAAVLTLQREQIEQFIRFCLKPPVAWIGTKNVRRFSNQVGVRVANAAWRPFVVSIPKQAFREGQGVSIKQYCPSQSAVKAIFTALSSFYGYLIQEGLVVSNPVGLIRQKSKYLRKDHQQPVVRRISNLQWDYVLESAEMLAKNSPDEHERTLFIMNCLFAMYLRISELVADERSIPVMGDFRKDRDGHWWFHVTGKGNKDRAITICDEMLSALKRYRIHLGVSPLPAINDPKPLVAKNKGKGPVTSTRHIRSLVQHCFDIAYQRMKDDGLEDDAVDLKTATVHWLRHTGISEDVKIRPREHVRDDAGHASMQTTDQYIESDLRERHASGRKKRVREL